jgi:hypothetical protein
MIKTIFTKITSLFKDGDAITPASALIGAGLVGTAVLAGNEISGVIRSKLNFETSVVARLIK